MISHTTSYPLWTLDQATVTRLGAKAELRGGPGIVAPTGKPGGVLMFHGNLVHALGAEHHALPAQDRLPDAVRGLQPHPKPHRAEWIAHRDFAPIEPVNDDALAVCAASRRSRTRRPGNTSGTGAGHDGAGHDGAEFLAANLLHRLDIQVLSEVRGHLAQHPPFMLRDVGAQEEALLRLIRAATGMSRRMLGTSPMGRPKLTYLALDHGCRAGSPRGPASGEGIRGRRRGRGAGPGRGPHPRRGDVLIAPAGCPRRNPLPAARGSTK